MLNYDYDWEKGPEERTREFAKNNRVLFSAIVAGSILAVLVASFVLGGLVGFIIWLFNQCC